MSDAEAPTPADAPQRRRPVWAIGAVLWVGVFAALAAVFFLRGDADEPTDIPAGDPPLKVVDRGEGGALLAPADAAEDAAPPVDPEPLPDFALTERRGDTVTRADLEGEVTVVGFIFTRCASTCPRVSNSMMEQRADLAEAGVRFVSLSVDPEYDTPDILTTYADFYGAAGDDDWLWLTGDRDEVYDLIQNGFEQSVGKNEGATDPGFAIYHTNNLMLVGPDATVRGQYNALIPKEMAQLRRDAAELAESAGVTGDGDPGASS